MKKLSTYIREHLVQPEELGHKTDGMFKMLNANVENNLKNKEERKPENKSYNPKN